MLLVCQQRFLFNVFYVFYFFHKNAFFNVFYSWGQRFLHLHVWSTCHERHWLTIETHINYKTTTSNVPSPTKLIFLDLCDLTFYGLSIISLSRTSATI